MPSSVRSMQRSKFEVFYIKLGHTQSIKLPSSCQVTLLGQIKLFDRRIGILLIITDFECIAFSEIIAAYFRYFFFNISLLRSYVGLVVDVTV